MKALNGTTALAAALIGTVGANARAQTTDVQQLKSAVQQLQKTVA